MGSDDESKLAAPKLFGRKKGGSTPPAAEPAAAPETEHTEAQPTEAQPPEAQPTAELRPEPEPTAVLDPVPAAAPEPPAADSEAPQSSRAKAARPKPAKPAKEKPAKEPRVPKRPRTAPVLSGGQAVALTGLLVGLFLVLATFGSLHLCSTVRGASTCGGQAGFPLLLAIGIIAVVGGGALLRAFLIKSPMGDSFLAVALVAVLTVLFLHNHYDAWWMIIAVPVLTILAFLLAHWVSVTYIDPMDE